MYGDCIECNIYTTLHQFYVWVLLHRRKPLAVAGDM